MKKTTKKYSLIITNGNANKKKLKTKKNFIGDFIDNMTCHYLLMDLLREIFHCQFSSVILSANLKVL